MGVLQLYLFSSFPAADAVEQLEAVAQTFTVDWRDYWIFIQEGVAPLSDKTIVL